MAKVVYEFITSLPHEKLFIVAHSKGGLIGKYVLAKYNQPKRVEHMVAINTPFSGSVYANYAPVKSLRLFSPNDKTLKTLLANNEINELITSVYSKYDPAIPTGGHLEGATNLPVQNIGHFRIIADPAIHQRVLAILEKDDN